MSLPKKGFAGLKENWKKDMFSGFVASLIALPLGLGLALASGAPPIAGIIAAVVGGIVVAIFGGSYVTISGPGNGLAVATLAAIEILGRGDMAQGWLFAMAAIVMSGVLLLILGLLRFGSLSDFFPSTAVEGMLAAIGVMILARQLHVMLGFIPSADSSIEFLTIFPATVKWVFTDGSLFVAAIGIGSLLILFFYAKIRNKIFHLVPAPMWVVVLSILLSYVLQWTGNTALIPTNMNIIIPEDLLGQYQAPDFSLIGTGDFWIAVITLTLIASIETLLSVKGIERLDSHKRKANTNRDLRAHGLATSISGLLGGLNVVTVLARSSVNVNNGAQTRNSNLFHALLLGMIIFFLEDLVSRIPLPALAAILVYTGYKLASPDKFKRIVKLGWEAATVYTITFFVTISQGIIPGILCGILVAFTLQLITTKRPGLILRNLFKPNALLYTEDDGTYILSVKKFANFMNFMRIRKKMDSIPTGANIIVDFTLCDFIDNSVMEHLGGYDQIHARKDGHVEIVGLDGLQASSDHPFATWIPIVGNNPKKKIVLSDRQKNLKLYAKELEMNFYSPANSAKNSLGVFKYFETKSLDLLRNEIAGEVGRARVKLFDVDYHLGEFIALEKVHISLVTIDFEFLTPEFILHEENLLERVAAVSGFSDINFVKHPDFSKRFYLKGPQPQKVKRFFSGELIQFFEANKPYNIESKNGRLLIFEKERLSGISEIKGMVSFAIRLAELLQTLHKK